MTPSVQGKESFMRELTELEARLNAYRDAINDSWEFYDSDQKSSAALDARMEQILRARMAVIDFVKEQTYEHTK